jgi:hypothetical protein
VNKQNWKLLVVGLVLIGGSALGMSFLRTHQKLGAPGIRTTPISGSRRLDIYLPRYVLDCDSVVVPTDEGVLRGLPQDTSFMQRLYARPEELSISQTSEGRLELLAHARYPLALNVVLMGTDRTSIHKPQFCLRGSGWDIDGGKSTFDTVHVDGPHPYDLQIMKMVNSREAVLREGGKPVTIHGIYVYWFVADHDLTADHWTRMRKMATHLLSTGELQRWAYVSSLGVCLPDDDDATYARMKQMIAAAVPKFQLVNDVNIASVKPPEGAAP